MTTETSTVDDEPDNDVSASRPVVIIGAGPAGLTAAVDLTRRGVPVSIIEADDVVGGISRTVVRDGWRFDIGGHRFFTKVQRVEDRWHELLGPDEFLVRERLSRIYYRQKFFSYPLKAMNALRGLGPVEALRSVASYGWARVRPPKDQAHFEGWVSARFGRRLYSIFFESYTAKVWGIHPSDMPADWAAQRIKNLSLGRAVIDALTPWRRSNGEVTSLIEQFLYPRLGPGMMWERAAEIVVADGADLTMNATVTQIERRPGALTVTATTPSGEVEFEADGGVISSMPLGELVRAIEPPAPAPVLDAAAGLVHRDFLTVAVVVPADQAFPDNWIYIHEPTVDVGRVQNFGAWSPDMVKPGYTCLGLEYFVTVGDELWNKSDDDLIEQATRELGVLGLADPEVCRDGWVVRMPKAYPLYDDAYATNVDTIRSWLAVEYPEVQPVGRNGMHRYNNQDHSMLTAMLAVENLAGAAHDLWAVNVDEEYHEEIRERTDVARPTPSQPTR